jgi:hypothetical protein
MLLMREFHSSRMAAVHGALCSGGRRMFSAHVVGVGRADEMVLAGDGWPALMRSRSEGWRPRSATLTPSARAVRDTAGGAVGSGAIAGGVVGTGDTL